MNIYLGFDPGGKNQFGWCVCTAHGEQIHVLFSGITSYTNGAFEKAMCKIPPESSIIGIGIDAPMFWVTKGGREADRLVRNAIAEAGAPAPAGTVQHFNSLRGACVIQGMLIAKLLRKRLPDVPITEAHPKALLWLLGIARTNYGPEEIKIHDVENVYIQSTKSESDHVRDAILGAVTAQAMIERRSNWRDLLPIERDPILAVKHPVGYWMPGV